MMAGATARKQSTPIVSRCRNWLRKGIASNHPIARNAKTDRLFNFWLKVCLIHLSASADAKDITIDSLDDPLRLKNQQPLDEKQNTIEVVMHAAEHDYCCCRTSSAFAYRASSIHNWRHAF